MMFLFTIALSSSFMPTSPTPTDRILDDPRYAFCRQANGEYENSRYCAFVDDLPEQCEAFIKSCSGDAEVLPLTPRSAGCGSDGTGDEVLPGAPNDPKTPKKPPTPMQCDTEFASFASTLLRWIVAGLVAVLVLVVLRVLYRTFGSVQGPSQPSEVIVEKAPEILDIEMPELPVGEANTLLSEAQAALAAGDHGRAVELARGVALRVLGERGRLRLHRSRTDREYLRQLSHMPDVKKALSTITGAFETHQWQGLALSKQAAEAALGAAVKIVAAGLWLLIAVPAFGQEERFSPSGDAAIAEAFTRGGATLSWRLRSLEDLNDTTEVLLIDGDQIVLEEEEWGWVSDWVTEGGMLILSGDPQDSFASLGTREHVDKSTKTFATWYPAERPWPQWPFGPSWYYEGANGLIWVSIQQGPVMVSSFEGDGIILAVADGTLFRNGSLLNQNNEDFIEQLLDIGVEELGWELSESPTLQIITQRAVASSGGGGGSNSMSDVLSNTRLLLFVLQSLLLWLLVTAWRGIPFLPRQESTDRSRKNFDAHVRAIADRWEAAGASHEVLRASARLWLLRLGTEGLRKKAQKNGNLAADEAALWVQGLEQVANTPDEPDHESDWNTYKELWTWTQ